MLSSAHAWPWLFTGIALLSACSRGLPRERAATPTPDSARAVLPVVAASASAASASPRPGARDGFAVVELFTSEGCSSCPPADRLLASVTAHAKASSLPVYTLSFHVDYWNYLGWRDPFSSSKYSERQHGYSGIGSASGTYTPQIVVNGSAECLGSDASGLATLIGAALERTPRTQIDLHARRRPEGIEVDYRVTGEADGRVLNLALVEPRADSEVQRGENANAHLTHVNVVRAFISRALDGGRAGQWLLPAGPAFEAHSVGLVAFTEDVTQRDISGAAALELP